MVQINEEDTAISEARCTMTYFAREYGSVLWVVIYAGNLEKLTKNLTLGFSLLLKIVE